MKFKDIDYGKFSGLSRVNVFVDLDFELDNLCVKMEYILDTSEYYEEDIALFLSAIAETEKEAKALISDLTIWSTSILIEPQTVSDWDYEYQAAKTSIILHRLLTEEEILEYRAEEKAREERKHNEEYSQALHLYRKYKDKLEKENG